MTNQVREIPLDEIRFVVKRSREKAGFDEIRDSMAEAGLHVPIEVIDHGKNPVKGFRYSLVKGQGRCTAASELGWRTIPALVFDGNPAEIAGRALVENLIRKPLPWAKQGRLIRDEMKRGSGKSLEAVAAMLHITKDHAQKCIRVLDRAAPEIADAVAGMTMNDAEIFTTLPKSGQKIVIEVVRATGAGVAEVARKARELSEKKGAGWTKKALVDTIEGTKRKLEAAGKRLKVLRLHWALRPGNLVTLLRDAKFRAALKASKVNFARFEEAMK